MKKSYLAAWLAAAVLAGSLLAGCGDTQTTQPKSSAGSAEQGASGSLVPALSQDELIAQSSLIVKGTVSEVSDAFQVKPETGGDASTYVDNTVHIEQTLRGQVDADTVTACRMMTKRAQRMPSWNRARNICCSCISKHLTKTPRIASPVPCRARMKCKRTVPVLLGTAPSGRCKTHRRQSNRQNNMES